MLKDEDGGKMKSEPEQTVLFETKVDRTCMELEAACNRLIAENARLRKAVIAARDWCGKPIENGGNIPDFAEDVAPLLDEALGEQ
jgi:hypothetical protein